MIIYFCREYPTALLQLDIDKRYQTFNGEINGRRRYNVLKNNIAEKGIQNPLVLDRKGQVILGTRRLLAAKELAIDTVPCISESKFEGGEWEVIPTKEGVAELFTSKHKPKIKLREGALYAVADISDW